MARRWSWENKVALVTGASSGIGAQVARDMAARGTTVVGVARRQPELEAVMAECRRSSPSSVAVVQDLSEPGSAEAVVERAHRELGALDVVVNNAGMPMRVHVTRLTAEQLRAVMDVNFMAAARVMLAAVPVMLAAGGGHIVNVSSVAGRIGSPRESAYTASKFALSGFTESAAADLAGNGVRLHLVSPGPIDTEIWTKLVEPAAYRGRFHSPKAVSSAVLGCISRGDFERWVPRWMGVLPFMRGLAPRAFQFAAGSFDRRGTPAPAD